MRKYTTMQGDTWDYIAYKVYGEQPGAELYMHTLLDANPAYLLYVVLPAGVVLNIPDIQVELPKTLPPWKRGA